LRRKSRIAPGEQPLLPFLFPRHSRMLAVALLIGLPLLCASLWLGIYFIGWYTGRWGEWEAADAVIHLLRLALEVLFNWT